MNLRKGVNGLVYENGSVINASTIDAHISPLAALSREKILFMNKHLVLIYNTAPRYREAIFRAIDEEYDCEWFFGETKTDIKEMDLSLLKNAHYYKYYGNPSKLYWKRGIISLLFNKKNQVFFTIAESRSLTDYFFFGLSRLLKKRVYVWTHGWYGKETKTEIFLKRWQFRHVDGIFVYSNYGRNLMIEQGLPADKIFTIHNSLHYDQQKALRESIVFSDIYREHFGNKNSIIIFIGRLTKVKKLDMVVDALANLKAKGENYNLVFIGDGVDKKNLETKVNAMGMRQNVWFYGACYDERQNAELIYNADLCVSPGNVGLTAMHALVFGCPVVTHNCFKRQMPEFEAVQAGVTGDFFEMDNVEALADCISKWFAEKSDKRDDVRKACFNEIDTQWNPYFQMDVIKNNLKF